MTINLPGGSPQPWGSEVLINITEAIAPVPAENYEVTIKASLMDGETVLAVVLLIYVAPDESGVLIFDLSPYLRSSGDYKLEFGESYNPVEGAVLGNLVTAFPLYTQNLTIVNEVIVENDYYTIPGGAVQLSGNPIQIIVPTDAGAMVGKYLYQRALKVTCPALIGSPFVEPIAPDANLQSIFEISGLVDQPMNYAFDFPAYGVITDHQALELNLLLDVGEIYIDANGDRQVTWEGLDPEIYKMRVLKGFLRDYELAKLSEIGKNFNSEYIEKGRFLTNLPDKMKVAPGQIVKLWLLSKYPASHSATWWCQAYYNPYGYYIDYELPVGVYSEFLSGECTLDPVSGLLEFNIEPAFMGFYSNHNPTAKILAYKFWLEDVAGEITEKRTFIIDDNYYEQSFFFYYVNPLSGIDSLWLHGEHTEGLKTEKETAYRPVPFGSGTKVPSMKTVSSSGQRSWELNTGYKSKEEILALRDFLESRECWMVDPDFPIRLIPVIIESGDFILFDSAPDYLPNLGIKILEAHR